MQVFILGMHRSGTSALARVLNLMGLYFGGENVGTGRSAENVKGFWERRDVRDLNDAILATAAGDWDVVSNLDLDALPDDAKEGYASAAADIVLNLDAHRPWFVKEPRLCVTLPIWQQALEAPLAVHIHRNPLEVARSLEGRNGIPIAAGLALWEFYNVRALQASEGMPRYFVGYEHLLLAPERAVGSLHDFLSRHGGYELRLPASRELQSFLDKDLHRHQADDAELSAHATPSQLALYEFLKGVLAAKPPREPSPDCLATLRKHEATVDLKDRQRRIEDSRARRTSHNLELQLAVRGVELRHAVASRDDAVERGNALSRRLDRAQDLRRDLTAARAVAEDRIATLRKRQDSLDREVAGLRKSGERFARQRDVLQRDVEALRGDLVTVRGERDQIRRARDDIRRARDDVERTSATLRQERNDFRAQRGALQRHKEDAANAAAARHAEVTATLRQWDAEIVRRRVQIAEADEFIGHLQSSIREWLGSRRWRLGDALATLPRRLTLRRTLTPTVALLQAAVDSHRAAKATDREAGKSHAQLIRELPATTTVAAQIANAAIQAESTRTAALGRMLLDRSAALARSAADIAERRRFANELIDLAETLGRSRRWHIGHSLLSLPRRLLGRAAPATAADFVAQLIEDHRRAATWPAPAPPPVEVPQRQRRVPAPSVDRAVPPPTNQPVGTESAPLFPPAPSSEVDVVVCVHNALDDVERCLKSVLSRTTVPYRLIVVNDGSDEPTSERLRGFAAEHDVIELIETNGPLGYTCAANRGLRASAAPQVVLLNSDTIVPRLWIEDMLECMASGEDVGIVGPLSNAASWQSVPKRTGADGRWAVNDLPPGYNADEFAELLRLSSKRGFPRVEFVNGFCLMVSRSVIDRVGLLDEESFPRGYGEEDDYCIRARDAGFALAVADQCFVYHAKSKSFGGEARDRLAQLGGETLERKHGRARLRDESTGMKRSTALDEVRAALRARLHDAGELRNAGPPSGCHVLFVLPVRGGSGGANSVIQEAVGMRSLGVDARVATHVKYFDAFARFYPEFLKSGDVFLFYGSDDELLRHAEPFQVVVATLWSTPALIAPVAARWPRKLFVYYVQDYEPWFFAEDDESRAIATDSYTLIPGMALMAKTDWICGTVERLHGRPVYRVAPSLDREVFHPGARSASDRPATIAAMIRPTTPRRGPLRTIRVLKEVVEACPGVRALLFGCEPQDLKTYIARNAPELRLDDRFENRGVLARGEVADLLRESDVFVDLSDYQAFGRSGLEAMACGCAAVLPKEGGVYEYAVHGENCLVVDTASDREMVDAVRRLATDAALRARMAERALETAGRFDILRASVSELAVFRAAMAARERDDAPVALYGRGVEAETVAADLGNRRWSGDSR